MGSSGGRKESGQQNVQAGMQMGRQTSGARSKAQFRAAAGRKKAGAAAAAGRSQGWRQAESKDAAHRMLSNVSNQGAQQLLKTPQAPLLTQRRAKRLPSWWPLPSHPNHPNHLLRLHHVMLRGHQSAALAAAVQSGAICSGCRFLWLAEGGCIQRGKAGRAVLLRSLQA